MVTILLWCAWLWQPERQLRLHQAAFRRALEHRDWRRAAALIDPGYLDRWGFTRETGIRAGRRWLGQFFVLGISAGQQTVEITPAGGMATELWSLQGSGLEGAAMVMDRVNSLRAPFVFTWAHHGWPPWDWRLIRMDNAELELTPPPGAADELQ